jgi:hypothetical protein
MWRIERWLGERARQYGPHCLGVLAAALVCAVPLYVMARAAPHEPEARVLATGEQLSALIADGDARVLIINARDRTVARSALGRLTRPWEPAITTLVAPADDAAAPGLLEALLRTQPSTVIVVNVPGADPTWAEIERICRERAIAFTIVADEARVATGKLNLTFLAGGAANDSGAVIAQRGDVSVLFALGHSPVSANGQLLISNRAPSDGSATVAQLTSDPHAGATVRVVVDDQRPIRVMIELNRLRVGGGARLDPAPVTSPAAEGDYP